MLSIWLASLHIIRFGCVILNPTYSWTLIQRHCAQFLHAYSQSNTVFLQSFPSKYYFTMHCLLYIYAERWQDLVYYSNNSILQLSELIFFLSRYPLKFPRLPKTNCSNCSRYDVSEGTPGPRCVDLIITLVNSVFYHNYREN